MDARVTLLEEWDGLELIEASYDRPRFARHAHPTYALGVVRHGVNYFRYRGAEHRAPAGTICTVTPDEAHEVEPLGFSYRCIYPSCELVRSIAEAVRSRPVRRTFLLPAVVQDEEFAQLVDIVFEAAEYALERDTALSRLLRRAVTRHAVEPLTTRTIPASRRGISRARDYLAAHHAENVALKSLAEVADMDQFALVRGFAREYGLPPHAWLIQERVRRAQGLLRAGRSLADVATVVGFTDQSHLTRCFKRILGVTPGRYRAGTAPRRRERR